jgi:voltage-gated potassium channel
MAMRVTIFDVARILAKRLLLPLVSLTGFLLLCAGGYVLLARISWVDAFFWIIHPHAIDATRVHNGTKLFSIGVYVGVFFFEVWIAERVLVSLFHPEGGGVWRSMMIEVAIQNTRNHYILCGYGQVGRTVVEQLRKAKMPFILIESNEGLYRQLFSEGMLVIHGDAKRHSVLEAAGIKRALGICALIDNDADNLYITITAKTLNPKLRVITRAGQERYAQAMRSSGADEVVIPEYEGGVVIGRLISERVKSAGASGG